MNSFNKTMIASALGFAAVLSVYSSSASAMNENSKYGEERTQQNTDSEYSNSSDESAPVEYMSKNEMPGANHDQQDDMYSSSNDDVQRSNEYSEADDRNKSMNQNMAYENEQENTLYFEFDSTELTNESANKLEKMKEQLENNRRSAVVEIVGYTDTSGPEVYNQYLSEQRAEAIKSKLKDLEIEVANWEVKGEGEANPIADNDTRDGREKNRRVEINFLSSNDAVTGL
jgi:outer membrane protein OmpA-like peptidoglycan-associated protein